MGIAVIGASGFIGSHTMWVGTTEMGLDMKGFDVAPSEFSQYVIDVTWPWQAIKQELEAANVEAVINYAGLLGTSELFDAVKSAIRVNIEGQYNVARACLEMGIPLVTIEQPHIWTNPYETTRGAGVRLARALAWHKGLDLATVTTFNAFGERQGYGGHHPQKFVPTFAVHAWNRQALPIFGDGEQRVNAIYAGDIARVFLTAIPAASPKAPVFQGAALGGNFTVNEIAQEIHRIVNVGVDERYLVEYLEMRDGETDDGFGAAASQSEIQMNGEFGVYVPRFEYDKLIDTVLWYKGAKVDDVLP